MKGIRIAYGGMAATPKRTLLAEQALIGKEWTEASVTTAMAALDRDYSPINDMRASAVYRKLIAKNLLYKFFLETSGKIAETRAVDFERYAQ